jgi:1-deoxy-D-xylulose-5-phosphate synthase
MTSSILEGIRSPADLRTLPEVCLVRLAAELRAYLIEQVSRSGGHLAAGLGTVELTIALHRVFETPNDLLVWDVGHQCYPHKVLTGRRTELGKIRQRGGVSGFLRRDESPYDTFGAGHSSTSISAALGMALASAHLGVERKTVAVIGDGGMTAGLAYEALDHAGVSDVDLLIVLNDNQMSISPNVGALSRYLGCGAAGDHGRFFEALGIRYSGPVDGHDLPALLGALAEQRTRKGPRLLHVVTRKGCGYAPAENNPVKYHGVTAFDPNVGIVSSAAKSRTYTDLFGESLCEMAERDRRLVAITPAMREGSGLTQFAARFPHRYFDVGIAEQHCVTFAAGLAAQGLRPIVAIYSTFLQRAYDQLVHDVALQQLPILFAIDRAGLVGPDGATHNGSYDLSFLRCLPNMTVMTPSDGAELRDMLYTGCQHDGPVAIRYPRAAAQGADAAAPQLLRTGSAQLVRSGTGVALLAFGTLLQTAREVAHQLDATVINMRYVKPLDARMILEAARQHELIVTLEENVVAGGAGVAVGECLAVHRVSVPLLHLGLPDRNIEHGTREEALRDASLDREGILSAIARSRTLREPTRFARRFHPASAIMRALSIGIGR